MPVLLCQLYLGEGEQVQYALRPGFPPAVRSSGSRRYGKGKEMRIEHFVPLKMYLL